MGLVIRFILVYLLVWMLSDEDKKKTAIYGTILNIVQFVLWWVL